LSNAVLSWFGKETACIIVYAFCVGALGSAVVTAAKIPSLSYAMGAEEVIHPLHRHNNIYTCTHTHYTWFPIDMG